LKISIGFSPKNINDEKMQAVMAAVPIRTPEYCLRDLAKLLMSINRHIQEAMISSGRIKYNSLINMVSLCSSYH